MEVAREAFVSLVGMGVGDKASLFFNIMPPKERLCSFLPLEG